MRPRHLLTSWFVLGLVLLLVAISLSGAVLGLRREMSGRATDSAIDSAEVIAALAVSRTVRVLDFRRGVLTTHDHAHLDAHVALLRDSGRLVGLEVWHNDGRLLYADPGHPVAERRLPAHELAEARAATKPWATVTPDVRLRGTRTLDVFLPFDADEDGTRDGLIEVLLPQEPVADRVARASRWLLAAALLLVGAAALVLTRIRRRVLARERAASRDPLTGVANRVGMRDQLAALLDGPDGRHTTATLVTLDLHKFRAVNTTFGHAAGDQVLAEVASVLRGCVRPGDVVARLGGDDFALLVTGLPPAATADDPAAPALAVAGHVLARLAGHPVAVHGVPVPLEARIGIVLIPDHGRDPDQLLRQAEMALHRAKERPGGVAVYDPTSEPQDADRLALLVQLRRALETDELRLHYQPKVDVRSGNLTGVEALVRWQHPTRGLLAPGVFLPLVESTSLVAPFTDWVLRAAVAQAAAWHRAGLLLPVAVNISAHNLYDDLSASVLALLAATGLPADLLELEVTETAVMTDPDRAIEVLGKLQAMGVRVAVDDFGVGQTSLRYLQQLPVHTLKIDRTFVTDLPTSADHEAIVESVITVGHRLGLTVLAEGVETPATMRRLLTLGCDQAQGYLIARPMPGADVAPWVAARASATADGVPAPREPRAPLRRLRRDPGSHQPR